MFVYQNKNGDICVTFEDNKPVENPEFVITVDKDAKTISLAGSDSTEVKNNTAELESQIDTLTKDLSAANTQISELEAQVKNLEEQLEAAKAEA